jgi:hypothetical protein
MPLSRRRRRELEALSPSGEATMMGRDYRQVRVRSSGRLVDVLVEGAEFFVLRAFVPSDHVWPWPPVAGPFPLDDPRFEICVRE